jgi:hypothetical protein
MIFLYFLSLSYASFDSFFEYQSLGSDTKMIPTYFIHYDAEYSSHILNYSPSLADEIHFYQQPKIFQIHQGSVSSNEFFKNTKLKIDQELQDRLQLTVLHLQQKDFENQQEHTILTFSYYLKRWIFAAYIDLEFQKKEDNGGAQVSYLLTPYHQLKLFLGLPFYDWNNRNRGNNDFEKQPYTYGFVGRYFKDKENYQRFFEYGFRYEIPAEWRDQALNETWNYKKWTHLLRYYYEKKNIDTWEFSFQSDNTEQDFLDFNQSVLNTRLHLYRSQALIKYKHPKEIHYETGFYFAQRNAEQKYQRSKWNDSIPFFIFHPTKGAFSYGYDLTIHNGDPPLTSKDSLENRGHIFLYLPFKTSKLRLAFTFDLDELNAAPWEGGHASFEMIF